MAPPKHDSDIGLGLEIGGGGSKAGSDILKEGSGVSPMFDELDALDLEMEIAASSGISSKGMSDSGRSSCAPPSGTSDISLGSDALKLEGSGLSLGEDVATDEIPSLDLANSQAGGSAIDLVTDEDGDLVLGGSSHGGDLSRTGDSGISLLDPADSGISLESPTLQLGGSAVESLELGEEEAATAGDPAADSAAGKTMIGGQPPQSDDDFLLTPLEEGDRRIVGQRLAGHRARLRRRV